MSPSRRPSNASYEGLCALARPVEQMIIAAFAVFVRRAEVGCFVDRQSRETQHLNRIARANRAARSARSRL